MRIRELRVQDDWPQPIDRGRLTTASSPPPPKEDMTESKPFIYVLTHNNTIAKLSRGGDFIDELKAGMEDAYDYYDDEDFM
ncbi:hypothetical protein M514_27398 [Trichuris suis]|uniref:Uncharacterized protein n=1 Tax=Trichuris suis TaxID=68888 RepID=A0A085MT95_9BILA|nr:hypothetical protein M514_27398 [Trichuris suis]